MTLIYLMRKRWVEVWAPISLLIGTFTDRVAFLLGFSVEYIQLHSTHEVARPSIEVNF